MKLKHLMLIAVLPVILLAGCKKEVPAAITPKGESENLFARGISAPAAATEVTLTFNSARQWSIKAQEGGKIASWIVATPATGEAGDATVKVSIQANTSLESRSGEIVVTSEEVVKTVKVAQAGRDAVKITGVTLSETSVQFYPGDTKTLTATVTPSNADEDKTVTWTSSDNGIVKVDGGVLTAVAEGEATITAKAGNATATCAVKVLHKVVEVESVTLDKTSVRIKLGETVTLVATVNPSNADDKTITWTTTSAATAPVSTSGVVTGAKVGQATVYATASNGKQASCAVEVYEEAPITTTQFAALADNAAGKFTGIVAAVGKKGVIVTDGTTNIYVYSPKTTPAVGDEVVVEATKTTYYNLIETKQGGTVTVKSSGNTVNRTPAVDITSTFDAYPDATHTSDYLSIQGKITIDGTYQNLIVEGATARTGSLQGLDVSAMNGKNVILHGYYIGTSGTGGIYVAIIVTSVEEVPDADGSTGEDLNDPIDVNPWK